MGEAGKWFGSSTHALLGGQEDAESALMPAEVEHPLGLGLAMMLPTIPAMVMLLQHHQPIAPNRSTGHPRVPVPDGPGFPCLLVVVRHCESL